MNEENTVQTETFDSLPAESSPVQVEETAAASVSETLNLYEVDSSLGLEPYFAQAMTVDETVSETSPGETEETTTITIVDYSPVIYDVGNGIMASVLFGAFLIAGLLVVFKIMEGNPHDH